MFFFYSISIISKFSGKIMKFEWQINEVLEMRDFVGYWTFLLTAFESYFESSQFLKFSTSYQRLLCYVLYPASFKSPYTILKNHFIRNNVHKKSLKTIENFPTQKKRKILQLHHHKTQEKNIINFNSILIFHKDLYQNEKSFGNFRF